VDLWKWIPEKSDKTRVTSFLKKIEMVKIVELCCGRTLHEYKMLGSCPKNIK
jgi:hypothetical protein